MIDVTLPDGAVRSYPEPLSAADVAKDISKSLAKKVIAAKINDTLVDLNTTINENATLALITAQDPEGVDIIRHSTAHLLAQAALELFPGIQVTIGPVIENGFYYDFDYERAFDQNDLTKLEQKMRQIAKRNIPVSRTTMTRNEAINFYKKLDQHYKVDIIKSIPEDENLSFYTQGDFIDLCRGPHVPHTGHLKVFKLTKFSGAYWRGDSNNPMLQRVYGTAWGTQEDQDQYLHMLEEAEKRDHRRIGKALDLFHQQDIAPGMVFWHEKGWQIWQIVEQHIRQTQKQADYQEVRSPQILDLSLWEKSGHEAKYSDEMFKTQSEKRQYAIKPMNCPCHVMIYNQGLKSYRDLPVRYAEFGCCHRNESSGSLHGLFRVRSMVQDDGHIFCTPQQVETEVVNFMKTCLKVYEDFGLTNIEVKLATRPENRIGEETLWDQAEQSLKDALNACNLPFELLPGEGAFYGPKIELHLRDCIGRLWQCGTMQLDFFMPMRLGAEYVTENNEKAHPIMLHRAQLGSIERFLGMLIEHYAGKFPLWLSPTQAILMPVSEKFNDNVVKIAEEIKKNEIRVKYDLRNEKIGYKIREHTMQRVPYLLVIGEREIETNTVSVRTRGGKDLGSLSVAAFVDECRRVEAALGKDILEE